MAENIFVTKSIWLASAICLVLGYEPEYMKNSQGVVLFKFRNDDALQTVICSYNAADLSCDACSYAETVKRFRGEIAARRG